MAVDKLLESRIAMEIELQKTTMLVVIFFLLICSDAVNAHVETEAAKQLKEQAKQFEEKVIEIADGVCMSVGTSVLSWQCYAQPI